MFSPRKRYLIELRTEVMKTLELARLAVALPSTIRIAHVLLDKVVFVSDYATDSECLQETAERLFSAVCATSKKSVSISLRFYPVAEIPEKVYTRTFS